MLGLICLDVDGTLVGEAGVPSNATWAAADRARSRGQHLTLCTARLAAGSTRGWAERLDPDGWHIFHTGAARWRPSTGELRLVTLDPGAVAACEDLAQEQGWVLETYTWDDYAVDSHHQLAVDHAALLDLPFQPRPASALDGEIVRVQFVVPIDQTEKVLATVPHPLTGSAATSPAMPGAAFVSVSAPGVSKAQAIAEVARDLGCEMSQVMMVGDGHNDIPAVAAVGWGVAMGNAESELKAVARLEVADVDQDGAAEAIDRSASLG